jgi:hypothetical protein
MMRVMMLRWSLLAKAIIAVSLGNLDALVSHQIVRTVPIWFIDLYAIPIEYVIASSVLSSVERLYKRFKYARKGMQR